MTVLDGKDICLHSLPEPSNELVVTMKLPPTMRVQLDNYAKDNKSKYVLCILVVVGCERHLQEGVYVLPFGRPHPR